MQLVSVIINCYNGEKFLKEAIDSVYNQTYQNWEIIFWDNASTDNSSHIAKSYDKRLKYFKSNINTSIGEARYLAITKAKGNYICFLDCDDVFVATKLEIQINQMHETNYLMSYGSSLIINENGKILKKFKVKNNNGYIFHKLLNYYEIQFQSIMINRSIIDKQKIQFAKDLLYTPDYDFCMKICAKNKILVIKDILIKYRKVKNSLSMKSLNIVYDENKYALDYLCNKYPDLNKKYLNYFKLAYSKLYYYKSIPYIFNNDYKNAKIYIKKTEWKKIQYLILYILLFLNIPSKYILRIINR